MAQGFRANDAIPPEDAIPIALLIDITSGQVLHERDADRRFVPASITKAMSAYVAFDLIKEGQLDPDTRFAIRPETYEEWHGKGSNMFIPKNHAVLVDDLIMGMMTVSANDAAIVLAQGALGSVEAWTRRMNETARDLGMKNSHFSTPNGWPSEGRTFTTANDLAILAEALVRDHPELFARYIGNEGFGYDDVVQRNHDPLIGRVEGADGIKTGYTDNAGFGFLGTAKRGGRRLVLVLAGADRSYARDRWARRYVEWGFDGFERKRLFGEGARVATARVQDGTQRSVPLVVQRPIVVNLPDDVQGNFSLTLQYDGPLRAPIAQGAEVATLEIAVPGMAPARVPLFAGEHVPRAGVLERISNAFARWLG
jgi:D-alanyl-D-alanine carboxypeptidase (penicillin-binding protein 5/6)